jgi:hypothetical protein
MDPPSGGLLYSQISPPLLRGMQNEQTLVRTKGLCRAGGRLVSGVRYGWRLSFMVSGPPNNSAKETLNRLMVSL